jgi:hypothetical protein
MSAHTAVYWRESNRRIGATLASGQGIYLGTDVPLHELDLGQAGNTWPSVTPYDLDGGDLPLVQMSLNWAVDDTFGTFGRKWGNGERVHDGDALGGTALRLRPGAGESYAWVWTTEFIKETPLGGNCLPRPLPKALIAQGDPEDNG